MRYVIVFIVSWLFSGWVYGLAVWFSSLCVNTHMLRRISFYVYWYSTMYMRCNSLKSFLGTFTKLWKATTSLVTSVRPPVCMSVYPSAWKNLAPTGQIFMKFDVWVFFQKSDSTMQVLLKSDKNDWCCTWRRLCIYDSVLLNSSLNEKHSDTGCRENQNTGLIFYFF